VEGVCVVVELWLGKLVGVQLKVGEEEAALERDAGPVALGEREGALLEALTVGHREGEGLAVGGSTEGVPMLDVGAGEGEPVGIPEPPMESVGLAEPVPHWEGVRLRLRVSEGERLVVALLEGAGVPVPLMGEKEWEADGLRAPERVLDSEALILIERCPERLKVTEAVLQAVPTAEGRVDTETVLQWEVVPDAQEDTERLIVTERERDEVGLFDGGMVVVAEGGEESVP